MRRAGPVRFVIPLWEFLSNLRFRLPIRRIHDSAPLVRWSVFPDPSVWPVAPAGG